MDRLMRLPGARLVMHAALFVVIWAILMWVNGRVDPLMNYYIALAAMYATAMFGMVILVGLSGQVSLGNGALMAIGAYAFALTSLNWQTVPILGVPMNGWWAMVFAGIGGIVFGLIIGGLGARLKGPYLAGLTLGIAVGIPAIANRFPDLFGGENGVMLTVPYPEGGYAPEVEEETFPDEIGGSELPTQQDALPSEGAGVGESLSADDLVIDLDGSGDGGATAEALPSAGAGVGESLSPDDLVIDLDGSGDAGASAAASAAPSVEASAIPDVPVEAVAPSANPLDPNFVIEYWQASLAVLVACLVGFVALNLVRGRQGFIWRAVRDDSVAAAVSGVSPAWSKVSAFAVSSVFAALAGGVFAQILSYVGPGAYGLGLSLSLLVGVVLGGRSALLGAVIGAVLLVALPTLIQSGADDRGWDDQIVNNMPNLIYGLLVVLVVLVAPGGIVGSIRAGIAKARRRPVPKEI